MELQYSYQRVDSRKKRVTDGCTSNIRSSHGNLSWAAQLSSWMPHHRFFFYTIDWTAPHFEAYIWERRVVECPLIGETKTKEFSPEKGDRCYRFFEETALGAQGP
jgi:hypothetical protein